MSIARPTKQISPAAPPARIAISCLTGASTPIACQTATGVSNPARWPKKMPRMPMWKRFDATRRWPRRSIWLDSLRQLYGSRS